MIERKLVSRALKEFEIHEFISSSLNKVGHSHTRVQRTPLGEKIIIYASRPGLIVGKKGQNIRKLTKTLKKKFNLENPQLEINEVDNPDLDARIVAERIANALEKYGIQRFKGVGHKTMESVLNAGALGIEIIMSGKIPSARAKSWRFYQGYLKKCGDLAISGVRHAQAAAKLKSGIVGIKVSIMPPNLTLPDHMHILDEKVELVEEISSPETPSAEQGKDKASPETSLEGKGNEKQRA